MIAFGIAKRIPGILEMLQDDPAERISTVQEVVDRLNKSV
jgi:hypothetical protein